MSAKYHAANRAGVFATNIGSDKEDGLQANCEPQHRSQGVSGTGTGEFGVRTLSIRSQ